MIKKNAKNREKINYKIRHRNGKFVIEAGFKAKEFI